MNKKLVIMLLLLALTFVAGCVQQPAIRSQEEASERITNVSQNTENVGQMLADIDKKLG